MEQLMAECKYCNAKMSKSDATATGWTEDDGAWQHDTIKVWINGKYERIPRCVAKKAKRGY